MKSADIAGVMFEEGEISVRSIDLHDLRMSLVQGWDDFLDKRGDLVFVGFIYPIAVVSAVLVVSHISVLPLIFPLSIRLTNSSSASGGMGQS